MNGLFTLLLRNARSVARFALAAYLAMAAFACFGHSGRCEMRNLEPARHAVSMAAATDDHDAAAHGCSVCEWRHTAQADLPPLPEPPSLPFLRALILTAAIEPPGLGHAISLRSRGPPAA